MFKNKFLNTLTYVPIIGFLVILLGSEYINNCEKRIEKSRKVMVYQLVCWVIILIIIRIVK